MYEIRTLSQSRIMIFAVFFIVSSLPLVVADGWDDFSNNLATDLAPFLSLFGEQVTKQYLSESVTKLDYIIFAIAPIGILTAVVSAIRVCGSSSLRAFIGRAQEGAGNAEAELCSSTSRDVCELFQNGGIARVFGRPKILEIMFDPEYRDFESGEAGIHTFLDHVKRQQDRTEDTKTATEDRGWTEHVEHLSPSVTDEESVTQEDCPSPAPFAPNLSLNIGIKKQPSYVFWMVAFTGSILQVAVLAFAGLITYHWQWERDGHRPDVYAFPLILVGTLLVSTGTYSCAALIGDSTAERTFYNHDKNRKCGLSIYWIQPGGQIIGDQTFDAFAYSEADSKDQLREYIISQKNPITDDGRSKPELATWAAVIITISGFVLQFTGLRGIHAVIPVAQLGVTLVMSMARAALRMRRFKPEHNCLSSRPDQVIGHELDWLALHIGREDLEHELKTPKTDTHHGRFFFRFHGMAEPRTRISRTPPGLYSEPGNINTASKLLAYRARLASLTKLQAGQAETASRARNFRPEMVAVREQAQRLANAIENTHNILLTSKDVFIPKEWQNDQIFWAVDASLSYKFSQLARDKAQEHGAKPVDPSIQTLYLKLGGKDKQRWLLELEDRLEALLGLWLWSLKSDPLVEMKDQYGFITPQAADIRTRRIIAADEEILRQIENEYPEYAVFFTENKLDLSPNHDDPSIIWKYDSVHLGDTDSPAHCSPCLEHFEKSELQLVRFFGWDVARSSKTQSTVVGNPDFSIWSSASNASLLSLCAQEIFASFFWSMLDLVHGFDNNSLIDPADKLFSQDSFFSHTVAAFIDSGIGDRRDALLCLLPPMVSHLNPLSTDDVVRTGKASAVQYRKDKKWDEAEAELKRVWEICKALPQSKPNNFLLDIAIAFGELYREGMTEMPRHNFGFDGIKWLDTQRSQLTPTALSEELNDAINRYVKIADLARLDGQGDRDEVPDERTALLFHLSRETAIPDAGEAKLTGAAEKNWMEVVLELLKSGVKPTYVDVASQRTALSYAAERGSVEVASALIATGPQTQLNAPDNAGRTPLSWAAGEGHYNVVELLGKQRGQKDSKDHNGDTPVCWAARNGHLKTVELLLRASDDSLDKKEMDKVRIELQTHKDSTTAKDNSKWMPMHLAAEYGCPETVKLLLGSEHVDTHAKDHNGRTALFLAIIHKRWEVVELLLPFGQSRLDANAIQEQMLMHLAAKNGYLEIMKFLLGSDHVDANIKDKDEKAPLHLATEHGQLKIVKLLLGSKQVDTNIKDKNERTALHLAAEHGHLEIVKSLLLIDEVDPEAQDTWAYSPLIIAAEKGYCEIVTELLQSGKVQVESPNRHKRTAIFFAAKRGQIEVVKLLLDKQAEPDLPDEWNETPVLWSARNRHEDVTRLLIQTGKVDLTRRSQYKVTPLSWAEKFGTPSIVDLIKQNLDQP